MSLTEKPKELIKQFDEAIANETEMAEGLREQYECMMECSDIFREQKKVFIEQCKYDAEYHEQITEWLKDLKEIKEMDLSIPQHFTKEQSDWIKSYCIRKNLEFYNKAIDDFAKRLKAKCRKCYVDCDPYGSGIEEDSILYEDDIDEIAEELKIE